VEESGLDAPWDERIDLRIFGNLCAVGIADLTEEIARAISRAISSAGEMIPS